MELNGMTYGYCRVSSRDQNEDRQLIAMRDMDVPEGNIFVDKQSGKDFNRPEFQKLMSLLKENDLIIIKSIDRLGRNYDEIQDWWRIITKEKKVDIFVIDMPMLDTRREKNLLGTFISDLVLTLLSYVAENERVNIRQRQAEGIAAAKARGVQFGRKPYPLPDNFSRVCKRLSNKEITIKQAAILCGMKKTTFYQRYKENGRIDAMPMKPRICEICGSEYQPTNRNQKYCSPICQSKGLAQVRKKYYDEVRSLSTERNEERKKPKKRPARKKPSVSLDEVARLAREAHMTYGQYVTTHNI